WPLTWLCLVSSLLRNAPPNLRFLFTLILGRGWSGCLLVTVHEPGSVQVIGIPLKRNLFTFTIRPWLLTVRNWIFPPASSVPLNSAAEAVPDDASMATARVAMKVRFKLGLFPA